MTEPDSAGYSGPFESAPPDINHLVLTGTLTSGPRAGRSPKGERVARLQVEFPVVDPECPQLLWTLASCEVEVPDWLVKPRVEALRSGTPILIAGQLSERWTEGSPRGVIVASLVHPGAPPDLFVVKRRP